MAAAALPFSRSRAAEHRNEPLARELAHDLEPDAPIGPGDDVRSVFPPCWRPVPPSVHLMRNLSAFRRHAGEAKSRPSAPIRRNSKAPGVAFAVRSRPLPHSSSAHRSRQPMSRILTPQIGRRHVVKRPGRAHHPIARAGRPQRAGRARRSSPRRAQTEGPFYPTDWTGDADNDLVHGQGRGGARARARSRISSAASSTPPAPRSRRAHRDLAVRRHRHLPPSARSRTGARARRRLPGPRARA